jgi:O-antigen/teichoic acid export membrane protein
MAAPAFQRAATVVPIIALAYLCEGLCYIATIGIMLQRKPIIRSTAAIVAALVNLALNVLLIPTYGMMGAAWATLAAFAVQMVLQVGVALRYYPIDYQWNRAARVFGLALAVYFVGLLVTPASLVVAVVAKTLLLASFPVALWAVGFFEESELERVRQLGLGLRKRLVPSRA